MPNNSNTFGFQQEFPAIAMEKAMEIGKEKGLPANDPKTIIGIMQSRTFQEQERGSTQDRSQQRGKRRALNRQVQFPGQQGTGEDLIEGGFRAQDQSFENQQLRSGVLGSELLDINKAIRQADFNREAFKRSRLKEMNPVQDIDEQIMDLRNKALVSRAQLDEKLKHIPPSMRRRALAERMGVFTDQISELKSLRDSRIDSATKVIDREIESKESDISSLESQALSLEDALDRSKERGETERDRAQLSIDLGKIRAKSAKARKESGLTTTEDVIFNQLRRSFVETFSTSPSARDEVELRRQAKEQAQSITKGESSDKGAASRSLFTSQRFSGPGDPRIAPSKFVDVE